MGVLFDQLLRTVGLRGVYSFREMGVHLSNHGRPQSLGKYVNPRIATRPEQERQVFNDHRQIMLMFAPSAKRRRGLIFVWGISCILPRTAGGVEFGTLQRVLYCVWMTASNDVAYVPEAP